MKQSAFLHLGLGVVAAAVLAACGGGGGGSDDDGTPTVGALSISGTAAKGAALSGATIDVRCAAGTGTATSGSDGAYSVSLSSATLPCVLRATGTEGSIFHAVVPGTGTGTFTANITPFSEMIVSRVAGAAPASYFSGFGSSSSLTASSVSDALAYVRTAVAGVADLGAANPLTDTLVIGNALDQRIDALMAALASNGLSLSEVSAAIIANPAAPSVVAAPLAPAASTCEWFKSGRYRIISPYETDPRWRTHVVTVDAAAGTVTDQDNAVSNFTDIGGCQYTLADSEFTTTTMVAPSGVLVMYSQSIANANVRTLSIGLPEQSLPLAELAGTWQLAGWDPNSGIQTPGYIAQNAEATFNDSGAITTTTTCVGLAPCTAGTPPFVTFTANSAGGFNLIEGGINVGRVFMFKTLAGKAVWVLTANDGQFIVASRKEALGALPAVGTATYFREFSLNGNGTVSTLTENSVTVTAINTAANSFTRIRGSDNRVDTLAVNSPRDGLRHRGANSCTVNGAASNCAEVVQLPLQGMGITVSSSVGLTNPATAFFNLSVTRPAPVN